MKKRLARLPILILSVVALLLSICLTACGKEGYGEVVKAEEGMLVIRVTDAPEGATLKDVMDKMQEEGAISFEESGGMILAVNGKDTSGREFWGLYTSATDFANNGWGSVVVGGVTYDSATLGYESLPALEGETYIWKISTW